MKIVRQIPLEFESDTCTQKELEAAAEYKLHEIKKSIGLSGIFPLRGDIKKKVFWHLQQDESITAVNHKGDMCIHPDGPPICQEGFCNDCSVHHRQRISGELV